MLDRLILNANIYTLDSRQPRASALAIHRDRILAVGGDDLRALAGPDTQIDDLGGAMLLPGLVDAHMHWLWTSMNLQRIDLMDVAPKQAAVERVRLAAQRSTPNEWLLGYGWAQGRWPDGAFPSAADLDPISPANPVFLRARSGHAAWINTAALRSAGISANTPNPPGGEIQRDPSGQPTGILFENAINLVSERIPAPSLDSVADAMRAAQKLAWQQGLTGFHDFDDQDAFEGLQVLRANGELGLRVLKNINKAYIEHAFGLRVRFGFGDDWLRIGALKLFADGALGSRTAAMIEPYSGEPQNRGIVVVDKEEMAELVPQASRAGLPTTIHAIGDRAVHDVLDVFEAVRAEEAALGIGRSARRHRVEHVQLIHPDDVGRLAALDLIASMQPIHATADYPMADAFWGARSEYSYNARMQLDRGTRVAFGSDSPVEPFNPLLGIHAAVTRRRADGSPGPDGWYPQARLTMDETLRGYTQGPAYAAGTEDRLGKLAPGFLADVTAFDRDLYAIDPDEILNVHAIGTMTGGQWRYRK